MILDLLVILTAMGVWFPRREPWDALGKLAVAILFLLWVLTVYAPQLWRV